MTATSTAVSQVLHSIESFDTVVQHQEEHLSGGHTTHDANCNPARIQMELNNLQMGIQKLLQLQPSPQTFAPIIAKLVDAGSHITRFPSLVMIISFFAGTLIERGGHAPEESALAYVSSLERIINEAHDFMVTNPAAVQAMRQEQARGGQGGHGGHGHSHEGGHGHSHGGHDDEEEEEEEDSHHGHSHAGGDHGHSHGDHGHAHGGHDEEEVEDDHHGHSHAGGDHGHSHGDHGHAHGGHDEEECEDDDHEHHGHSHDHGHAHGDHAHAHGGHDEEECEDDDHDHHGHSHAGGDHGHAQGGDDHGHAHGGDDHGHSHGGGHGHAAHGPPDPELEGQEAYEILGRMCPPSALFLGTNPATYRKLSRKPELLAKMDKLRWTSGGLKMLHSLVSVLYNEKVVIIHPEEKRGFVVKMSGVSDNHQFHAILMDLLCGLPDDQKLQGTRPSPAVVECMTNPDGPQMMGGQIQGLWDMCHWTVTRMPADAGFEVSKSFVWGEGVPADISKFHGERVVILRRPLYTRSWNCVRVFGPLAAEVKLERVMPAEEVEKYLASFQAATQEEQTEADTFIASSVGDN